MRSNLGNVHQQQGRPELAVEDYSKAVQLAPEVGWAGAQACLAGTQPATPRAGGACERRLGDGVVGSPPCLLSCPLHSLCLSHGAAT